MMASALAAGVLLALFPYAVYLGLKGGRWWVVCASAAFTLLAVAGIATPGPAGVGLILAGMPILWASLAGQIVGLRRDRRAYRQQLASCVERISAVLDSDQPGPYG